jgi:hypothetical protein
MAWRSTHAENFDPEGRVSGVLWQGRPSTAVSGSGDEGLWLYQLDGEWTMSEDIGYATAVDGAATTTSWRSFNAKRFHSVGGDWLWYGGPWMITPRLGVVPTEAWSGWSGCSGWSGEEESTPWYSGEWWTSGAYVGECWHSGDEDIEGWYAPRGSCAGWSGASGLEGVGSGKWATLSFEGWRSMDGEFAGRYSGFWRSGFASGQDVVVSGGALDAPAYRDVGRPSWSGDDGQDYPRSEGMVNGRYAYGDAVYTPCASGWVLGECGTHEWFLCMTEPGTSPVTFKSMTWVNHDDPEDLYTRTCCPDESGFHEYGAIFNDGSGWLIGERDAEAGWWQGEEPGDAGFEFSGIAGIGPAPDGVSGYRMDDGATLHYVSGLVPAMGRDERLVANASLWRNG